MTINLVLEIEVLQTSGVTRKDGRYDFAITYKLPNTEKNEMDWWVGLDEKQYNQFRKDFKVGSIIKKTISWENK